MKIKNILLMSVIAVSAFAPSALFADAAFGPKIPADATVGALFRLGVSTTGGMKRE
ncbi:MAG: hypothetical protein K6F50_08505 [Kiritimatiellae bacterium]|nr:hypothetical protein [Kiritimatiellia bacterium]